MADQGQRTEQPTHRRIQKARKEGNYAVSREFVAGLQFLTVVLLLSGFSAQWLAQARQGLRHLLGLAFRVEFDVGACLVVVRNLLTVGLMPVFVAGGIVVAVSVGTQLLTTQMGLAPGKLKLDWNRLSPLKKLKGLPRQNVPQFVQAALLLPLFAAAVWGVVSENLPNYLRLPLASPESGLVQVASSIEELLWKAAGLFLIFGCWDLVRQRRRYFKDLRMTKQEIRDEIKELEGNPLLKSRIRRLQRDLLRRRMMQEVPRATAVVVNPTHYAVALRYEMQSMGAPRVVAKGKNYLARRIRELAVQHQVPVVENPPLAQVLYKTTEVGQEIPAHLYRAVAEILAYIYRLMHGRLPA